MDGAMSAPSCAMFCPGSVLGLTWHNCIGAHFHQLVAGRVIPVRLCEGLHTEVSGFANGQKALLESVGDGSTCQ